MQKYKSMHDGPLRKTTMPKQRIVLCSLNVLPIRPTPFRAGSIHGILDGEEVAQMETAVVAELAVTARALSVVFVWKTKSPRFCVGYHLQNAICVQASYALFCKNEAIDFLGKETMFLPRMFAQDIVKLRWTRKRLQDSIRNSSWVTQVQQNGFRS